MRPRSSGECSVLQLKLFGLPLLVGVCASLIGCATTGAGRAPTQTLYSANAVAPAAVSAVQLPSRLEWQVRERSFDADEDVTSDALQPMQGAYIEAANDLPAAVRQAAAQLAWKERVDALYVVQYQITASSDDDFETAPVSWKVHLTAREMALVQAAPLDTDGTGPPADPTVAVGDDDDAAASPSVRPKRGPRPASLIGLTVGVDSFLDVGADLSVGKKGIRGHAVVAYDFGLGQPFFGGGAGYAFKIARSWVEIEPAVIVEIEPAFIYLGEVVYPMTVYVEPTVFARWFPTRSLSVDFGSSALVPLSAGSFSARAQLGVGLHF